MVFILTGVHDPHPKTVFKAVPGTEAGIEAEAAVRILPHGYGLAHGGRS